ncbi:hypothetical protein SKAU_G00380190 [Synaphobranchus kaupii]|uniref:F-BAR domain-containing protein n=1 Tax=Synaphobranchus kaupii TaxID=118154 RepID=A0A9Q1EDL0_SYNKA|nr:hypothetical protein SKAU_G00380190 [Synaphobranchus kaupii]
MKPSTMSRDVPTKGTSFTDPTHSSVGVWFSIDGWDPNNSLVVGWGWGTELWDQYDILDKHTQSGLDLVEKYVKFVKERTEIEQAYAKQLRNLTKKYTPKRGSKEEQECKRASLVSSHMMTFPPINLTGINMED